MHTQHPVPNTAWCTVLPHLVKLALSAPALHMCVPFSSDITPHEPPKHLREDVYHLVFKATSPALLQTSPVGSGTHKSLYYSLCPLCRLYPHNFGGYFCCCFTFG